MSIPLICVGLLAFLVIALGLRVSMARAKSRIAYGYPDDPEHILYKSVRAHSNAVEYVPIVALLIYILSLGPLDLWVIWCAILFTAFRYLAAFGILFPKTMAKPNPIRFLGALGTYIFGLALSIALILRALGA